MPKDAIQTAIPGAILDLGASLDRSRSVGSRRVGHANAAFAEQDAAFEDVALGMAMGDATARKFLGLHERGQDEAERRLRLRAMALLARRYLCETPSRSHVEMAELAMAAMDPKKPSGAALLAARHGIGKMAVEGLLKTVPAGPFSWNVGIVPDGRAVQWLVGGGGSLGILTPKRLAAATRQIDAAGETSCEESDCPAPVPLPAKTIRDRIAERVVGLDGGQLDVVASRLALHMARARLLACNHDPGTPNEVILVLRESGTGKTFLCETAGQVTGLPFGACNAAELTLTGYVGQNAADAGLLGIIQAAKGRVEAARFGLCCYDEITKRAAAMNDSVVTSTGVLNELLRIVQGQVTQVGGKRSNYDSIYWVNTYGMFFFLAGHAPGLDRLIERRQGRATLGFGGLGMRNACRGVLLDALEDYGLTAELINRLTAVVVLPPPRLCDLIKAATSKNGVISNYNRVLTARHCILRVDDAAVREMAAQCLSSRLYYRGLSSIVSSLAAEAVTQGEGKSLTVRAVDVRRVVERLDDAAEDLLAHKRAAPTAEGEHVVDGPGRLAATAG